MAHTDFAHPSIFQTVVSAAKDLIETSRENALRHRKFAQTYNELSALSNNELADIGLNRGMIQSVAYEAAYGETAQ